METNKYTVVYSDVNSSTWAQAGVIIWIYKAIKKQLLTTHTGAKELIKIRLNIAGQKLLFFGFYAPEEGRVEENENFYNQLQEILNKTNTNGYILLSGDLNAGIRNAEIHNMNMV